MREAGRYGRTVATSAAGRPRHPDVLTPAEWTVLHWVRHGLSRRQVAALLGITEGGVRYHVRNIRAKLQSADQVALRRWVGAPADSALALAQEGNMTADIASIGQVALLIRDTDRARAFYGEVLGLSHLYTYGDLSFFDCAGTRLYLQRVPDDQWRPGSIVYFTVADINARHRKLADQGVHFHGAPHLVHRHDSGLEEWMVFFDDAEGNTLALMSQVAPKPRDKPGG
jgi:DNA-binding CsgD family transcriptional regulator/predicted enzyme related to lactoylglutathione lyase